jgi:hypothetical protein
MYTCLTKEFVTLVYESSTNLCSPSSGIPALDYRKAANNNLFMIFQSYIDDAVDVRQYKGGWLINDVNYLTEDIGMGLGWRYFEDNSFVGQLEDIRDVLMWRTRRFHFVDEVS